MIRAVAPLVGGNCNNGLLCGPFALLLNNAVSNSNWNIGAAQNYYYMEYLI